MKHPVQILQAGFAEPRLRYSGFTMRFGIS
jgi:hypothetical protein